VLKTAWRVSSRLLSVCVEPGRAATPSGSALVSGSGIIVSGQSALLAVVSSPIFVPCPLWKCSRERRCARSSPWLGLCCPHVSARTRPKGFASTWFLSRRCVSCNCGGLTRRMKTWADRPKDGPAGFPMCWRKHCASTRAEALPRPFMPDAHPCCLFRPCICSGNVAGNAAALTARPGSGQMGALVPGYCER
jgi:hypothetical protein